MLKTMLGVVGVLALVATGTAVMSSSAGGKRPTVKALRTAGYGKLLVTSHGLTLYHYTAEKRGAIVCTGACARLWPPLLVKGKQRPIPGLGVKASRLGTIERPDGGRQVTYNGYALYRYAPDRRAGDVRGQGVEHEWYVISSAGTLVRMTPRTGTPPSTESDPPPAYGYR